MNAATLDATRSVPSSKSPPAADSRRETVLRPGLRANEWELVRPDPSGNDPLAGGARREQFFPSLGAAVSALATDEPFLLALPLDTAFVQRLELPVAPPDELTAMTRLQLEKLLPYAPEALSIHWEPIPDAGKNYAPAGSASGGGEAATRPLAVQAIAHERMLALGEGLEQHGRWPQRAALHVGLLADAVARAAPAGRGGGGESAAENALLVTREGGRTVVGILEHGRLVLAQSLLPSFMPEFDESQPGAAGDLAAVAALEQELPTLLLGAELQDVPTNFRRLWLDPRCAGWQSALEKSLHLPVSLAPAALTPAAAAPADVVDLSPPEWLEARRRQKRAGQNRRRLRLGAMIYFGLILLGLLDLGWLHWRRASLDKQLVQNAPRVEQVRAARARWDALAPAVDLRLSVAELLEQVRQSLPADGDVRLTLFDLNRLRVPATLTLEGEAPSYASAVELNEKLQARPELRGIRFTSEPPANLANGRARFRILGTLP